MTEWQRQGTRILNENFSTDEDREHLMTSIRECKQDWRCHWELLKSLGAKEWDERWHWSLFARTFYPEYYEFCRTIDRYGLREEIKKC